MVQSTTCPFLCYIWQMIRFQALWKTKSLVKVCLKFKLPLWTKGLLIHLSPLWQLPLWHFPRWHNFPVAYPTTTIVVKLVLFRVKVKGQRSRVKGQRSRATSGFLFRVDHFRFLFRVDHFLFFFRVDLFSCWPIPDLFSWWSFISIFREYSREGGGALSWRVMR